METLDKQTLLHVRYLIAGARKQAAELETSRGVYGEERVFFSGMRFAYDQAINELSRMIYDADELERNNGVF